MDKKIQTLFGKIEYSAPSDNLEFKILNRIREEKERRIKNKLVFSYLGMFVSTGLFFYAFLSFEKSIWQSDFWNIAYLLMSDAKIALFHWDNFILSLLETFPAVELATVTAPIFTLFLSFSLYRRLFLKQHFKYIN